MSIEEWGHMEGMLLKAWEIENIYPDDYFPRGSNFMWVEFRAKYKGEVTEIYAKVRKHHLVNAIRQQFKGQVGWRLRKARVHMWADPVYMNM